MMLLFRVILVVFKNVLVILLFVVILVVFQIVVHGDVNVWGDSGRISNCFW